MGDDECKLESVWLSGGDDLVYMIKMLCINLKQTDKQCAILKSTTTNPTLFKRLNRLSNVNPC